MKTVLVTGGSRGIGAAIVRRFAEGGDRVIFFYRQDDAAAQAVARACGAQAMRVDVASEEEVTAAVSRILSEYGHLDVLVNNAAIAGFRLFTDITAVEWERFTAVNLNGPFFCTRAVLPSMIQRKCGRIINISSMWGQTGAACEVHYSATKAGLIGMTRALAKEVGPSGITVNCIAPGVIDTDMNAALSEADRAALIEETPLLRLGAPRDVAEAAYFLAGDGAAFITGQVLGVNGGFVI